MHSANAISLVPESFGAPFEGGFYGGQVRVGDAVYAIAWAPKATGEIKAAWLSDYANVPGASSTFDSAANTQAMAAAGSPLAQQALAADINGHKDWLVPARDVLELAYRHLKPTTAENGLTFRDGDNSSSVPVGHLYTEASPVQTQASAFQEGGAEAFDDTWYWSSTQYGENDACTQDFDDGDQLNDDKKFQARCRFVRLIPLNTSALQSFEPTKPATTPPRIGEAWAGQGGIYCGIARGEDGAADHHLILSPVEANTKLDWDACIEFAKTVVGDGHTDYAVPTRFESALLYANVRDKLDIDRWHWTSTQYGEYDAYGQSFGYGSQDYDDKLFQARCRFVRRLPI